MKKLVFALLLVVVLGSTAFAAFPANFDQSRNIDVHVNVAQFACITDLDTSDMVFDLTAPSTSANPQRQFRGFTLAANTPVFVELEETVSKNIYDALGLTQEDIVGNPFLVTPYIKDKYSQQVDENGNPVDQQEGAFKDGSGAMNRYAFDPGEHDEHIVLMISWNAHKSRNPEDEYNWWILEAGNYEGELIVTVVPQ